MGDCDVGCKRIVWNRHKVGNYRRSGNCIGHSDDERWFFKGCQVDKTSFHSELEPFQWWAFYGKSNYPQPSKVDLRVYQVPTQSSESEKTWCVFNNVHTETRNKLDNSTVEKLVFDCIN